MSVLRRLPRHLLPVVAVGAVAAVLNLWAVRAPLRVDLTSGGVYTIAPETRAVIERLERPVEVTFFYDLRSRAMTDARFMLEQIAAASPLITLVSHDPVLDPAAAERHGVRFAGTTVFESGGRRVLANRADETAFTNALIRVSSDAHATVCFTDGHVESNPFSLQSHDHHETGSDHGHEHASGGRPLTLHERHGLGKARQALETLGYTVEQRLTASGADALDGCSLVVVASPQTAFEPAEVRLVSAFVGAGGRALFLLEPGIHSGLEPLLASFGIGVSAARVEDPARHYWTDPATPAVSDYARHRVTRRLALSFFPGAAALAPVPGPQPAAVSVTPLIETSASAVLAGAPGDEAAPRTLALLAHDRESGAQIGVVGDGDFATNSFFDALGNGALLLNLVAELAGGENLLDIRPRDYAIAALELSNTQLLLSFVLTAVLGPLLMLGAGLVVWWRRR